MSDYAAFLTQKRRVVAPGGIEPRELPPTLFDWQKAIVRWAVRKGRAAIFADCGLGKTFMQVAWAQSLDVPTLMLAPLCVAEQTIREAAKLGISIHYATNQAGSVGHQIVITNYERLDSFDPNAFQAVVLDESSILKAFDGKTRQRLIAAFGKTKYRLCCTATPSPNDIAELANHAEFLGLMTRAEFLATWFVHDDQVWRMKRHAVEPFYRWLASWAVAFRRPSDLGYNDAGFVLPPLTIRDRVVPSEAVEGSLFAELATKGLGGRLRARRGSLEARVDATVNLVDEWGESWMVWCGLNDESAALAKALPNAVEVTGADSYSEKVGAVEAFISKKTRVLVSKAKILGFGLNFQHCARMVFVGLSDSYESYYQCIRRCWRYGQTRPVDAWIVVSEAESVVVNNVRRKEATADSLSRELLAHMTEFEREELTA